MVLSDKSFNSVLGRYMLSLQRLPQEGKQRESMSNAIYKLSILESMQIEASHERNKQKPA